MPKPPPSNPSNTISDRAASLGLSLTGPSSSLPQIYTAEKLTRSLIYKPNQSWEANTDPQSREANMISDRAQPSPVWSCRRFKPQPHQTVIVFATDLHRQEANTISDLQTQPKPRS